MKSIDIESVRISLAENVWSTTFGPTRKLTDAFKISSDRKPIYLIFSVNESGGYQGFARMTGPPDPKYKPHLFKRSQDTIPYEANFEVEWQTKLMLYSFRHLNQFPLNPLNEMKTIMQSKNC